MKNYSFELGRGKSSQRQMKVQEILRAALVEVLQRGLTKEPLLDNEMITINYVDAVSYTHLTLPTICSV